METSLIDKVLTTEIVCTYCSSVSNPLSQPRRTRDRRCTRPKARALPRGTQRTHSTPSRDDGVERRYLPRSALRASLGRLRRSRAVSGRKPTAPKAAEQAAAHARSNACGARAAGLASAPRCALRASLGRFRRRRAVGGRKPAAPMAAWPPARSNAAWLWSFAKEPSADARSRARLHARELMRGRDAPALPRHTACGAHLGPRPPKQLVWHSRTPPRMGERAPSRRARVPHDQPAARPDRPSARPASCPPLALDQRPAYGRESPARSHGNPMSRAQR